MSSSSSSSTVHSNLQNFLNSVTPIIPAIPIPQSCIHDLNLLSHPVGKAITKYFMLGDLWKCYSEWSVYGSSTPVMLNNGENVMQYYIPYLSAIQIYTNNTSLTFRNPRDDTHMTEFEVEFSSDDSESDKHSILISNNSSKAWDATSADSSVDHGCSWPMRDRLGNLYFQYYDTCSPYWRIPLIDKIADFAPSYPGIVTLKSINLSLLVAYPIYHIPPKGNIKDLSACFLTFHTLSSTFQDTLVDNVVGDIGKSNIPNCSKVAREQVLGEKYKWRSSSTICLTPFGLCTYKMQGDIWMNPDTFDYETLINLHSAASSWLKQLNVQHHDFKFFTLRSMEVDIPL